MKNTPYIKIYENGVLSNPIKGQFKNEFPNRRVRRYEEGKSKKERIYNNSSGIQLVISRFGISEKTKLPTFYKAIKQLQYIPQNFCKNKSERTIIHYA